MTKTEKLRAQLIARGFTVEDHRSQRECLKGPHGSKEGHVVYIWLDRVGGGRYVTTLDFSGPPRKMDSMALQPTTIARILEGRQSNLIGGVK
jgi:hypothetical protein